MFSISDAFAATFLGVQIPNREAESNTVGKKLKKKANKKKPKKKKTGSTADAANGGDKGYVSASDNSETDSDVEEERILAGHSASVARAEQSAAAEAAKATAAKVYLFQSTQIGTSDWLF
jgi:hypothetical protein